MHYRKLGYTGLDVSTIGFGTWQLGGKRWNALNDQKSVELLQYALSKGINFYDVAVVYGQYIDEAGYQQSRSQELLGKAFNECREKVIYSVKVGQFDEYSHRHLYEPARIVQHVQESLRRLQTEYLDICLIHAPSIKAVKDEKAITILKTLQAQGVVKFIGYSFEEEPEHVTHALKQDIDVIMLQYNLIDTKCQAAIESARLKGVGILVGGPYKRGYLTGKYRNTNDLPLEDDYWKYNLDIAPFKVSKTLETIKILLDQFGSETLLRQTAIHTILSQAGACSCIIGQRDSSEIDDNLETNKIFHES